MLRSQLVVDCGLNSEYPNMNTLTSKLIEADININAVLRDKEVVAAFPFRSLTGSSADVDAQSICNPSRCNLQIYRDYTAEGFELPESY